MAKLLDWLIPKEKKFFKMLENQASNVVYGVNIFNELIKNYESLSETRKQYLIKKIKEVEGIGDIITHNIVSEIHKSFITPFDKEDLYNITVILDDIIDLINASAVRLDIFRIKKIPRNMWDLFGECNKAILALNNVIKNLEKINEMQTLLISIHSYENKADEIYHDALATILNDKHLNCVDIIKYKEIYDILEHVLDKCELFTQIVEGISVKHG